MKFEIDDLPVLFPYDYIYPEQYQYMCDLKQVLDAEGHCLLEMPSGTGKTVSLLSLIVAYIQHYPDQRQLVYCSRTVPEIEKALLELQRLMKYRETYLGHKETFLALGLSSRKNLCIHPTVSKAKWGKAVDAQCRSLTASWVREKAKVDPMIPTCTYYENLNTSLPNGVYTLESLKEWGKTNGICPYFLSRRAIGQANVIIYSYHYLLDPKVADLVSQEIHKNAIVVFDEAHNIDNVCIESMSVDISRPCLESSSRCISSLMEKIELIKETDIDKLKSEYQKLVEGLREVADNRETNQVMANPVLPEDILQEAVPGNIRKAEHFVAFLRRFVEYLKTRLKVLHVVAETPTSFLQHLKEITFIERKPLQFCAERLSSLVRTLEITDIDEFTMLNRVTMFATLISTYSRGFMLIFEPFENDATSIPNPILHLACLDASLAIQPVFKKFSTVIITSGTLSPLEMYPQILQVSPILSKSYPMTLTRACFCPMVITRGSDQVSISSKFEVRNDPSVVRNYGQILMDLAKTVPDGIVCFFPSYLYLEAIASMWHEMHLMQALWKYKLVFVETPDAMETSIALGQYRLACDHGRGAILLSVARGKISEGIDFDHHYGRAVVMFGIPYQYTESRILRARLEYLRETYFIRENDFLAFDALRHAAQCVGRVLRGKSDYGVMVFADKRYARADKRNKLPQWISAGFNEATTNLSTDVAVLLTKKFLKSMAQPFDPISQLGVSLWSLDDIKKHVLAQHRAKHANEVDEVSSVTHL